MNRLFAFFALVLSPLAGMAQHEPLLPIHEYVLPNFFSMGSTTCAGCGQNLRVRYQYDGVDSRRTELGRYIRASGDPDAIAAFARFERQRGTALVLGTGGGVLMGIGTILLIDSNRQPATLQLGSGSSPQISDPGRDARRGGVATFVAGGLMITAAALLRGESHESFHRSVQFYNRSLGRVQLSSTPFVSPGASGMGLTLRF